MIITDILAWLIKGPVHTKDETCNVLKWEFIAGKMGF